MVESHVDLEKRVANLEKEVSSLRVALANLGEIGAGKAGSMAPGESPPSEAGGDTSEEILSWVSEKALLPRISTLCFLLVVALALRTVTDSELLDKQLGALLGMVYAGSLLSFGAFSYRRNSPLAPVFTFIGVLLLCTIVVETHSHFEALSTIPAYLILTLAGSGAALISYCFRVALPVFAGTLGMSLAALAIDYPNPSFPWLSLVLLVANLLGAFATRLQRCSWLRWILLVLTLLMLQVWGLKIGLHLGRGGTDSLPSGMAGYLPILGLFTLVYLGSAVFGIVRFGQGRVARFDIALPGITVAWIFLLARYVSTAGVMEELPLGLLGSGAALGLLALAFWLGSRRVEGAPGTNAFMVAAILLFGQALPLVVPGVLPAMALLSLAALGSFYLGERWRSGGVRVTSCLLQLYASGALSYELYQGDFHTSLLVNACASTIVVFCGVWHYHLSRSHGPPKESLFFARIDPEDRGAIFLLLAALAGGYFSLRSGIFLALKTFELSTPGAFSCYQSVLVNGAAIVLMLVAYWRGSRELRNVAILVTLIGGGKVFLGDLFVARGLPLVLSVFSFGLAAALDSLLLGRWHRSGGKAGATMEG